MFHNKRFLIGLLALFLLVLLAPGAIAQDRNNFIFVRPLEIVSVDPATITESQSGFIVRNVYSRLVDTSYDGGTVSPDLAESWEVSDDGLVYTFHLRAGVVFHDGTPLRASDVVYSLDRLLNIGEGEAPVLAAVMDIGAAVALDDQTVQITLNQPFSAFLEVMGYPRGTSIMSQAWVEANATEDDPWATAFAATNAMGTGPYVFNEWIPNEFARMTRFEGYYGGPAPIEEVISLINKDDTATRLMMERGEIDAIQRLPEDIIRAMEESNADIVVQRRPTDSSTFWAFDTKIAPFDDARVRQAIVAAVDYDSLMNDLVQDGGTRMNTPVYANMEYHHADYPLAVRDLDKAKALLAEAGYADGLDIDLIYVDFGLIKQISVVLQAHLAEAGINANLVEMPFGPFLEGVAAGEIGFYSWVSEPNYPQAIAILERFTADKIGTGLGGNISSFTSEEYDGIIAQIHNASADMDPAELEGLFYRAQEILVDEAVWLLLYQEQVSQVVGAWIEGFDFGAYNYLDMRQVSINR